MSTIPPIALGCDGQLFKKGNDVSSIMDRCLKLGVYYYDTARGYGDSERVLGEYVRSHGNRDAYYIISKGCLPLPFSRLNVSALRKDLEKSLQTLDSGYIDLYLLHRDDRRCDLKGILTVLHEYQQAGKIRSYGVSNWTAARIEEANRIALENGFDPIAAVSDNFTLVPWEKDPWGGGDGCVSLTGKQEDLNYLAEHSIPNFSYSPLGRGFLTGRVKSNDPKTFSNLDAACKRAYLSDANLARLARIEEIARSLGISVPELTIAYIAHFPVRTIPVFATGSPERLTQNVRAASIEIPKEIMDELMRLSA